MEFIKDRFFAFWFLVHYSLISVSMFLFDWKVTIGLILTGLLLNYFIIKKYIFTFTIPFTKLKLFICSFIPLFSIVLFYLSSTYFYNSMKVLNITNIDQSVAAIKEFMVTEPIIFYTMVVFGFLSVFSYFLKFILSIILIFKKRYKKLEK